MNSSSYKSQTMLILMVMTLASTSMATSRKYVYQKQNDEIVIRTCISGQVQNKTDCVGPSSENRVGAEYFMKTLLRPYLLIDSDKLKPLSEEEKKGYRSSGLNPNDILQKRKANLTHKLGMIEELIKQNKKSADAYRILKRAKTQLLSSEPSSKDVLQLNEIIKKFFDDKLSESQSHGIIETESPQTVVFWRQFDASIPECGADDKETIEQRISGCATNLKAPRKSKKPITWQLVARQKNDSNGKFYEVWKDTQTGLIWGDLYDRVLPYYFLVDLDESGKVIKDKLCSSPEYRMARAGITQQVFSLPTITELEQALKNGISEVAPNMNNWFWSATTFPNEYQDLAWGISSGANQFRDFDFKYYYSSVRCVSHPPAETKSAK